MRPGPHVAEEGSFGRSAGEQTLRGAALLVVAVLIGIFLLHTAPSERVAIQSAPPSAPRTTQVHALTPTVPSGPTTTAPLRAPSQVSILVANGTRVPGAASRIKNQLLQAGYNTLSPTNATASDMATTVVNFQPGYDAEAAAAAAVLSLPPASAQPMPSPPPVTDSKGANLIVVIGNDLASGGTTTPATSGSSSGTSTGSGSGSNPPPPTSPRTTSPPTTARVSPTTTSRGSYPTTTVKH